MEAGTGSRSPRPWYSVGMDYSPGDRKRSLRREMRRRLEVGSPAELEEKSCRIRAVIAASDAWRSASLVAAYYPMPGEPDLLPLLEAALAEGRRLALPRVEGTDLVFRLVPQPGPAGGLLCLRPGTYGISEPAADLPRLILKDFRGPGVLVLVPGLAFDRRGGRLGRGKGFYDRFLRTAAGDAAGACRGPAILGVCFSLQLLDDVPMGTEDRRVDAVVTEEGIAGPG